jgi:type I restriction enzyme, S subunit
VSPRAGFERRRLKYAASINDEVLGEDTSPEYELQYVDIGNVDSFGTIHEIATYRFEDAPSRARRLVHDGDVIISTVRTYLQAIAPIQSPPDNLVVSTGFAVVRPRRNLLDARFCKYALREPGFLREVESRSVGVSYPAINVSDLGDIRVALPAIPDQLAIADFLDREIVRLDLLVAAKERLLKGLTEKRCALITQAVTRGLDPGIPFRESGVSWIGYVPEHWPLMHLKRVLVSTDYGISESVNPGGKIAILRMGDLLDGNIDYSHVGYVDTIDPMLLLKPGDLVFNRTNSLDQIGKVAIFRGNNEYPVSFASYLVRLRCRASVIPEFLNFLLNSTYVLAWGRSEAFPAIGQANLNPNRYGYLPIVLPPVSEQRRIVDYIATETLRLDQLYSATKRTIGLLKERRAALIGAAVIGQIGTAPRQ